MGGLKKEKGQSGAVTQFLSRKQAMRRLQLSLPNFRRLCIWKGIHAVTPGAALTKDGKERMWFARKDIARICADPILDLMRQERVEGERIRRSKARKEGRIVRRVRAHQSVMDGHLARMVRERWPTRESALLAVGEAIGTVLIVAHLPTLTQFPGAYIHRCRRLMLELYQYVIRTRAVRHAYISVKGVYVQASLDGVPVTWLAPHDHASATVPPELDYRMLAIAMRLDSILLQSVLTGLYEKAGLVYPPKFDCPIGTELSERDLLANMAVPLVSIDSNGVSMDTEDAQWGEESAERRLLASMDGDAALAADREARVSRVRRLFAGHTVFVSREVPRDVFVLLARACGADQVSWDESGCAGAPLPASSPAITLHVVDRDALGAGAAVSRAYVQPQYLADSINAARLLPVADYLPGQRLVAHVSPFAPAGAEHEHYCPPEMRYLRGEIAADQLYHYSDDEDDDQQDQEIIEEMEQDEDLEEDEDDDEDDAKDTEPAAPVVPVAQPSNNKNKSAKNQKNRVSREELDQKIEQNKQRKLQEMSLPKKRKNLYNKMKFAENKRKSQLDKMADKRRQANRARSAQSEK